MLTPFVPGIWTEDRRARFFGVECGSRMTVVRLRAGGLFVHSPVGLDDATRAEVDALGEVRAVVAPSIFHHLHLGPWMQAYPRAVFFACPGLDWKRPDLAFTGVLGDVPHEIWADDLDQVFFSARRENEVDFYHRESRTFLCADALLNLWNHPFRGTRVAARMMGNRAPGVGYLEPFMIRDRKIARRQVDRILAWDIDGAVLSHGDMLAHGAHEAIRHAYAWL